MMYELFARSCPDGKAFKERGDTRWSWLVGEVNSTVGFKGARCIFENGIMNIET